MWAETAKGCRLAAAPETQSQFELQLAVLARPLGGIIAPRKVLAIAGGVRELAAHGCAVQDEDLGPKAHGQILHEVLKGSLSHAAPKIHPMFIDLLS